MSPFVSQHGLRVNGLGSLVLLDNLGDPSGSRAERYEYDEVANRVRLVGVYGSSPGVIARLGGTTQQLLEGRTLVAYVFGALRIRSLYDPDLGMTRKGTSEQVFASRRR